MNKNFEDAYKADVQQNIPDLWNRIESSLPPKKTVKNLKSKKKKNNTWIKWAGLAAACFMVLLILPAMGGLGVLGMFVIKGSNSTDMSATEGIVMEDCYDEDVTADSAWNEDVESDVVYDTDAGSTESADDVSTQETVAEEGAEQEASSSLQQEQTYRELIVEDMSATVIEVTATSDVWYTVTLSISDMSSEDRKQWLTDHPFYENRELTVYVYEGTGEIPVSGEKYRVTLYNINAPWQSAVYPYEAVLASYE